MQDETIKASIENYKRQMVKYGYNEVEQKQAVDDLYSGLSVPQVETYLGKGFELRQMRVMSMCMKKGYPEEVITTICNPKFDGFQMEVALEFYEKGIPIDQIGVLDGDAKNSVSMRKAYEQVLLQMQKLNDLEEGQPEYVEKLVESIDMVVKQIQAQDEKYGVLLKQIVKSGKEDKGEIEELLRNLKDKDELIHKLSKQIEEAKSESDSLNSVINKMEKERREMEEKSSVSKQAVMYYGMPVSYETTMGAGVNTQIIPIERTLKKSNYGVLRFASALGFKKKSRQDLVKMIACKELIPEQLVQIRVAIQRGLDETQLSELINNNVSADRMREIIEIAVLQNARTNGKM